MRNQRLEAPRVQRRLLQLFHLYARWYLWRHMHAIRVNTLRPPKLDGLPVIVCMNHPSWWDPLVALFLASRLWPRRRHYGPIDARMLEKYRFFRNLGFFGVDPGGGPRAAAAFLATSTAILSDPDACLWITAEGEFADVRRRPLQLKPGLAHLARRLPRGLILPLAIEYTFWTESTPEALLRFGQPLQVGGGRGESTGEWNRRLASQLETEMDQLAARAAARDPAGFRVLLSGDSGTGSFYDWWRCLRARVAGREFDRAHMPEAPPPPAGAAAAAADARSGPA